ncbi:YebC/PmpR family DNA-binding transcriptional regulator [Acetobacterium wieringae]|uniref:Probable transcriptional regulatory protein FXB42_13985 n=1 Tax=Acetobacterium wieringae TaxID=52694 RepID=A0A5D0WJB0_9FIRM|nr:MULTISPECIES: YebC/PmpR family DNA-binding transcriptional regulator [Acetobacterium]MEA4805145.1 YebC/PmpR family DNA-binding transcriptional regulator [Acetobacterium wieringae]OXS26914.1 MAG: transcriptional regulator [Acetobacterium sp. MES1]TYC84084.1 YebC/PmpR family DNA-binding transcriptional regulator [Acetobacterium wieringae]UYO64279.1 YebC/PmpR family DNA-binding transcriptional regulator [Acetobacterium wieringae]VUZ24176.1 putative transcriptional regulatory protein [Acetobact
MSGHSKWSTIKHKKGKADAKRGQIFTKLAKYIAVASREGGSDPDMNAKLKEAIAKAKAANMPNDNIDRAIKKGAGELQGSVYEEITYEGYGPGGVAVIVETLTDNKNRTAGDVRHAFDKNGGNLGTSGCVGFLFTKKGQIMIEKADGLDEEALMMLALDAGAEDIETAEEGYEISTEPVDFGQVCDALKQEGYELASAEIAMIPSTEVELTDATEIKKMLKMIDMFDDNEDVQAVWHNWTGEEDE